MASTPRTNKTTPRIGISKAADKRLRYTPRGKRLRFRTKNNFPELKTAGNLTNGCRLSLGPNGGKPLC